MVILSECGYHCCDYHECECECEHGETLLPDRSLHVQSETEFA